MDGAAAAFPNVSVSAKPGSTNVVSLSIPDFIANYDPRENNYGTFKTSLAQGRDINVNGTGEVLLGSSFATEFK